MVKKLALFFAYFLFFMLCVIYFAPKENLYYLLEQKLQPFAVIISDEKVIDSGFSLKLKDAKLYVQSVESADISEMEIKPFFVFNALHVSGIELAKISSSFAPTKIEKIDITQSLINPVVLHVSARGEFGEMSGSFNMLHNHLSAVVKPSELMLKNYKNSLRYFSINEEGEYVYDKDL